MQPQHPFTGEGRYHQRDVHQNVFSLLVALLYCCWRSTSPHPLRGKNLVLTAAMPAVLPTIRITLIASSSAPAPASFISPRRGKNWSRLAQIGQGDDYVLDNKPSIPATPTPSTSRCGASSASVMPVISTSLATAARAGRHRIDEREIDPRSDHRPKQSEDSHRRRPWMACIAAKMEP